MVDPQVMIERAEVLLQQKRYRDVETTIRQVLTVEPENDQALAILGSSYLNSKRIQEGMEAVQQALAISPNNSYYFYLLGFGYYQLDQPLAAIDSLNKALALFPYHAEYFGLLAFCYLQEKEFEQGLDQANNGLQVDPENITCLNARATALNKLKRSQEAIDTMQDALAQDPDNEMTHSTVGWTLLEKGKHKEARKHFLEALRINPNFSAAKSGLKESLKSKVPPYRWLLQYSFWLQDKSKGMQRAMPFIIYIIFRVLIAVFRENKNTSAIAWGLAALYILLLITSWTIHSIANFFLLFDPVGKFALTKEEKTSSLAVIAALVLGLAVMLVAGFTNLADDTPYEMLFIAGLVCLSLALPLGRLRYPIRFSPTNRSEWFLQGLLATGVLSLLVFIIAPSAAATLFILYCIAFVIFSWWGVFR